MPGAAPIFIVMVLGSERTASRRRSSILKTREVSWSTFLMATTARFPQSSPETRRQSLPFPMICSAELPLLAVNHLADIWCRRSRRAPSGHHLVSIPLRLLPRSWSTADEETSRRRLDSACLCVEGWFFCFLLSGRAAGSSAMGVSTRPRSRCGLFTTAESLRRAGASTGSGIRDAGAGR